MIVSLFTTWEIRCGIAEYSRYFADALSDIGLEIHVVKLDPFARQEEMENLVRQMNDADLAHIQYEYSFFKNYDFSRFIQGIAIPKIVTMHEKYPAISFLKGIHILNPYSIGGYLYRIYLGRQYCKIPNKIVSKFIVHSDNMKRFLRIFGIPPAKIEVFPLPVPPPGKIADKEKSKSLLSLSGKIVLTIFGFINLRKGYEVILKTLSGLPEKYVLLIAGGRRPGDYSGYIDNLKQQVERAGLASRVRFTGYIPDDNIPLIMSATDIILAPFTEMSNSASLSVAIGYGKTIIASDLDPNRQIHEQGKCLELFKTGSSSDLRRVIMALIDNIPRKKSLEDMAKQYAKNYSYRRMAEILHSIYRQVLSNT